MRTIHLLLRGKIYCWTAKFRAASNIFYNLLDTRPTQFNETGCNIIGHLVGTLCKQYLVPKAKDIARQMLASLSKLGREHLATFRNIQLSLAEALVCHGLVQNDNLTEEIECKLEEASLIYTPLKHAYDSRKIPKDTWASEFGYLRICFGRALIRHLMGDLIGALHCWDEARQPAAILKDNVTVFTPMIIDYSCCNINLKMENREDAKMLLEHAKCYYREAGREHWWTGLGTFWLSYLRSSIANSGIDAEIKIGFLSSRL